MDADRVGSLWLGPTGRRPSVEVLTDAGERIPFPLGVRGAFDEAVDRIGWAAIRVGYQAIGLHDGELLRFAYLPPAWGLAPAADPELVLVARYSDRSRGPGELETIVQVDRSGRVLRSVTADGWGVAGELLDGTIATRRSLLSWDGERRPLPTPGEAVAVLSGRFLVLTDRPTGAVHVVDTASGRTSTASVPERAFLGSPVYDAEATQVILAWFSGEATMVVRGDEIRPIDVGTRNGQLAWIDRDHVLAVAEGTITSIDIDTGTTEALTGFPRHGVPRLNISGRFDPAPLRHALRPAFRGPVTTSTRDDLLRGLRTRMHARMLAAGLAADELIEHFVPAVRMRSHAAPEALPIAASHFGGRPDLPTGRDWPVYDGRPMMFIGQFRVDEINAARPETMAPVDGLVVLFAGIEADGGDPVADDAVHVEIVPNEGLHTPEWPDQLPEDLRLAPAIAVLEPLLTPPAGDFDEDPVPDVVIGATGDSALHQMGGVPITIQPQPAPDGHRLAFVFGGDPLVDAPDLGDGGQLIVWTPAPPGPIAEFGRCLVHLDSF